MAISRITSWASGNTLTASALNGEFNNILDNALALISPLTGNLNVNAKTLTGAVVGFNGYTEANLPAASTTGLVARVTNNERGLWMDTGSQWFSLTGKVINVMEFGAVGDGVADDRTEIDDAIAALPSTGGVLYFPEGTYLTNSASALVAITDKNSVTIRGAGQGSTILRQNGTGHVIAALGTTQITNCRIEDLSIVGNDTAAKGIDTSQWKDGVIARVTLSGCLDFGIDFRGVDNLHNVVADCKISSGNSPNVVSGATGVRFRGNANRLYNVYFNNGGNGANRYQTSLDVNGGGGHSSFGCIYDGVATAILTNGLFTSVGDWFDFTSGGTVSITTAFSLSANNALTVVNPSASPVSPEVLFAFSGGASLSNVTLLGSGLGNLSLTNGQPHGTSLSPTELAANTNNYAPVDANSLSGLYFRTWRITASGAINVTGITAGIDGQRLTLVNPAASTITLTNQDTNSTAANRFLFSTGANIAMTQNAVQTLVYDGTTARWRDGG